MSASKTHGSYKQPRRNGNNINRCLGSHCMAWRWTDTFKDNGSPILDATGYCGLAGKP
jgi:hypothetical protein